jgi:hypothetical protein
LKEEQDAWAAAVAAVRAEGKAEGQAALEQEEQEVEAAKLKETLGGKASKAVVAAAVARAVNEAATSKTTQHVMLSFSEARVFLQECTTR